VLGDVLLSQDPAVQVPSALEGLTVVFEMGTRGSPPPSPPNVAFAR
jgi:K+ transporter